MNKNYAIVIALMMFFNLSLFSQDGPPWDFNGTDHGFVASNYTALAVGDTYLTYSINSPNDDGNGGSSNPNFKKENAMLDTSPGNFIAVTLQNLTANTRIVVILTKNGNNTYTNFDGLTPNNEGFVTHYINVGGSANWNGEVDAINFRFKQGGGVNNNVYAGDILFDHIEVVDGIPSTPRMDYTFDDPSDAEGFVGGNGVSLSQPNAGSIVANISANSPYPKFEQSGIYSVDADTYKYVEINLTNNSPKNRITFVSPSGGNQFSGSEMVQGEQLIYLNLSEMTNWNGTYSNWWLQLVENPGDGPVASAGEVIIDRILFTDVNNAPMPFHDVTFNVNTANINVGDFGMFLGDGIFGGSNAEQMSDDDGDGIYSVTLSLPEGTSGNYAFFNSPDADNAWSTKENLEGQECADSANYNSRFLDPIVADTVLSFCFASCEEACPDVTLYDVSFNVDTNNIEVGPNGMYVGGGFVGNAVAFAMSDDDMDGIYTKVLKYAEGTTGNYIFLNSPVHGGDWDAKEVLTGQDCADGQYDDRLLDPVTGDTTVQFCYGTCDTECVTEEPCEFSIVLTDLYGDGWNGNSLDVLVNGEVVLVDIATAIADGQDPVTFTFSVVTGDVIDVVYDPSGTWDGENAYVVYNNQGEEIAAESGAGGGSGDAGPANTIGLAAICAEPQNFVTADPNYEWGGYMVVFDVDGNYMFESGWDVADLQTTLNPDVPNIILEPNFNTYNAEDPYWSNGEIGNKIMLATTQVESDNLYNGVGLTFSGSVAEHTLGEDYEAVYFIKCLDQSAGWTDMLNAEYEIPLPESGEFSVSVSGDLLPEGKLVQFGFYVRGLNANPALDYGKVVIGDIGLSIGDNDSLDMVIYPNPVNGDYVTIQTPLNGDKLVEVFDVNGRKVMERLLTTDTLNVGSISAGMYIVKVTVEGQSNVSKLIVE